MFFTNNRVIQRSSRIFSWVGGCLFRSSQSVAEIRMEAARSSRTSAPPPEFICPISLELMIDPVTTSTGITYDRSSIEKWFDKGNDTCPSTMQSLDHHLLVPNHAIRCLIHSWCSKEHLDSPSLSARPIDRQEVLAILEIVRKDPKKLSAIRKLRAKARESVRNSRCILDADAVPVLASVLCSPLLDTPIPPNKFLVLWEETIGVLALLPTSNSTKRTLVAPRPLKSIAWILREGSAQGKVNAVALLDSLASEKVSQIAIGSAEGVMEGLVELLRDRSNQILVNSSLRALLSICLPMRIRVRAVEEGGVGALIELLTDSEGGVAEHVLMILELICGSDEGRATIVEHALAIPALVKKILRISDAATDYAIGILWTICKHCSLPQESLKEKTRGLGLSNKLLLLLRRDLTPITRHKVIDILDIVYKARMDYD